MACLLIPAAYGASSHFYHIRLFKTFYFFFFFPKEELINSHVYLSGFAEAVFHSTTWPGDLSLLSREE